MHILRWRYYVRRERAEKGSLPGHGMVENTCRKELAGAAMHASPTERILIGMFLGKQGEII